MRGFMISNRKKVKELKKEIESLEAIKKKNEKLITLIEINTYITNSLEKDEILKRILNQIKILLKCELSSILLVDKELNRLSFAFLSKDEESDILKDTSLKMGEGIAGTVWQNGMPIVINDAQQDPRFSNTADKKAKTQTNSLIAVPLTVNGEIIGVIEAMNKKDDDFSDFDLQILQFISTQSAIAIKNANLYNMAIRDGMTKLFINKYFRERLQEEWRRSVRRKHNLSLVIFDIDFFKDTNDTYGHQAGDKVIKEIAKVISKNCRNIDIPCRYGGEEFTVILPETDKDEAMIFCERIRIIAENLRLEHGGSAIRITMSGGLASTPDLKVLNHTELIEFADNALYYSKENGRNRISYYDKDLMGKKI